VVPVVTVASAPGDERDRHALDLVPARSDNLDPLLATAAAVGLLGARCLDGDHRDSFEFEIGFRPQDVADLGHGGDQIAVQRAPRLPGPRGAPRPRSVVATAGQLDIDSARHPSDHATADSGSLRTK
jgi:hypothetical protein